MVAVAVGVGLDVGVWVVKEVEVGVGVWVELGAPRVISWQPINVKEASKVKNQRLSGFR